MDTFEKSKIALRKHLLENRKQVIKDLEEMRAKSTGEDIFNYVEKLFLSDVSSFVSIAKRNYRAKDGTIKQGILIDGK